MGFTPQPTVQEPGRSYEVEWTTISYRTIAFYVILVLLGVAFIVYLIAPKYFGQKFTNALEALGNKAGQTTGTETATTKREAHFLNIDGTVKVKRAGDVEWIRADFNTSLEKGDFVQTGNDGVARIIFADGTNYTLKPDSLIVVEESREDPVTKATKVAVQVTSGAVDLSTGRFEIPGSTSQVAFADAVANLSEESRAVVRNDPTNDVHEFTVDTGQAQVTRGSSTITLGQYEQAAFKAEEPGMLRGKVMAPPALIAPPNMELKMVKDPKSTNLDFAWSAVPDAVAYHLQISPSVMLSNFAIDRKVTGRTSTQVSGLDEGTYYWIVTSIDSKGVESQPSQPNRLNLVQDVGSGGQAYLEITNMIIHGKVVEVQGKTEPGASVIINNEQVFSMAPDGTFRHFTPPVSKPGANQITITVQNRKGDTKTIHKTVVIE
jgi:hypothetical protein